MADDMDNIFNVAFFCEGGLMSAAISVFSLGFTKKTAEQFFALLRDNQVKTVLDVRLNNVSQLAGFAKRDDLRFFLHEIGNIDYVAMPDWAPTDGLMKQFKNGDIVAERFQDDFWALLAQRNIERDVSLSLLEHGCLLCSEHEPHRCHRRLVLEYLQQHVDLNLHITHLL